ncbi:hypothetical protein MSG28_003735 [Choristoneura fumiferana]|uniref:Uncharacterized protein n=1 Tax=Choristoneura fumiferana TaxID=7141 RepID=A0ACC0KGM6_CHOFU|nr:hypothetical protein MSG28_003735 [Choristoneura fumiferana]
MNLNEPAALMTYLVLVMNCLLLTETASAPSLLRLSHWRTQRGAPPSPPQRAPPAGARAASRSAYSSRRSSQRCMGSTSELRYSHVSTAVFDHHGSKLFHSLTAASCQLRSVSTVAWYLSQSVQQRGGSGEAAASAAHATPAAASSPAPPAAAARSPYVKKPRSCACFRATRRSSHERPDSKLSSFTGRGGGEVVRVARAQPLEVEQREHERARRHARAARQPRRRVRAQPPQRPPLLRRRPQRARHLCTTNNTHTAPSV